MTCPVCRSERTEIAFTMKDTPAHVGVVYDTAEAARTEPRGTITLRLCSVCSFVWNSSFDSALTDYTAPYDASLHHSPRYRRFLEHIATDLANRHDLAGRLALEVGCGEGTFLRILCGVAGCDGLGIDPSASDRGEPLNDQTIRFRAQPFGSAHVEAGAALGLARHWLHCFSDPVAYTHLLSEASGAVYIEVPNAAWVFGTATPWTVFYEHVCYFSQKALYTTLAKGGLQVETIASCYDEGQYLCAHARPSFNMKEPPASDPTFLDAVRQFSARAQNRIERAQARLSTTAEAQQRVVVWGAAGRGTTFLNRCDPDGNTVLAAVDNNPARKGSFTAGTGHPVVTPDSLPDLRPDLVILTNQTYETEIRSQVASLGIAPNFFLA